MAGKETNQVLDREREFHNKRFALDDGQRAEDGFYRALRDMDIEFRKTIANLASQSDVLDYGCGAGERALDLHALNKAKSITGIDISEEAIKIALRRATAEGTITTTFYVDNCEKTKLAPLSFDLIYGNGIIHHLNTEKAVCEINRLLRPKGSIVFYEPLGMNPLINLYRRLTPQSRSPDEHPLLPKDFAIIRRFFPNLKLNFYGFFSVAMLPFYGDPDQSKLYRFAAKLDRCLFRVLNPIGWAAWAVLITAKKQ